MKWVFVMCNERKKQDFLLRFNAGHTCSTQWASALQTRYKSYTHNAYANTTAHTNLWNLGNTPLKTLLHYISVIFAGFMIMVNGKVSSILSIDLIDFNPLQYRENQLGNSRWPPAKEALCIDHKWRRDAQTHGSRLYKSNIYSQDSAVSLLKRTYIAVFTFL